MPLFYVELKPKIKYDSELPHLSLDRYLVNTAIDACLIWGE